MNFRRIFSAPTHSLRAYLTKITTAIMVLVISIAAYQAYQINLSYSAERYEAELKAMAQLLMSVEITTAEQSNVTDKSMFYEVWLDGERVAGTFPMAANTAAIPQGLSEQNIGLTRWQVYHAENTIGKRVLVGFNTLERFAYADALISHSIIPFVVAIPLCIVIVLIAVRFATQPLQELQEQLFHMDFKTLKPLELQQSFNELVPVVSTINHLLNKLHGSYTREQTFSGNVAHELRTPLSVLKVNIENAVHRFPEAQAELAPLGQQIDRLINVTNQLLMLAKTHPDCYQGCLSPQHLTSQIQAVIREFYPKLLTKRQKIAFYYDEQTSYTILTDPHLFDTLVVNLLSNAHKYTQEQACIEVYLRHTTTFIELLVADSGGYLEDEDISRLTARFFRAKHTGTTEGAGLGLALIQQIVVLHDGLLQLRRSDLGGLEVSIRFPLYRENKRVDV